MIIDLDNTDNLLLKSNRITLKKGLEYFSKITSENIKNIWNQANNENRRF